MKAITVEGDHDKREITFTVHDEEMCDLCLGLKPCIEVGLAVVCRTCLDAARAALGFDGEARAS